MSATVLAHDDDDDDDDDDVHLFDPMGDGPLLLLIFLFSFIKASLGVQTEKSHLLGPSFKLIMNLWKKNRVNLKLLLKI